MTEIRSLWVARWDITSPEACSTMVRVAAENGFNTIIPQVRGRGDAFYKSHIEPRSEDLAGQSPDFDPLGQILEQAHAAGIEVHAWINANLTWGFVKPPVSPNHIVNKHPDWLMRTDQNKYTVTFGKDVEGTYTCPSNEEWREMYRDIYLDVVDQYEVDGVHFDFIRYPSPRFCYCDRCLGMFETRMDGEITAEQRGQLAEDSDRIAYTKAFPDKWDDYRREQITAMVYKVHDAVKKARPKVIVSASVFPDSSDAYNHRFQDWKRWMADGKIDLLCPMAYTKDPDAWAVQIKDAVDSSGGVPVCAGLGAWQIGAETCIDNIRKGRDLGAAGFSLFSYSITKKGSDASYLKALNDNLFLKKGTEPFSA